MNYTELITSLKETFINQDSFIFDKHVPEFKIADKFLGDCFSQIAVEPLGDKAPRFYHTFSPFDVISNKSPQYAAVYEDGKRLLDIEFDTYVSMRTAAMNAVVLKGLGVNSLMDKKVLLFGAGKIACETVKILASELSLSEVDVISKSGDLTKISSTVSGVTVKAGNRDDISQYDIIICHTNSTEPVISMEHIDQLKHGAILTSFISSAELGEFPDSIYDEKIATIISDWDKTIVGAKDLQRAKEMGLFGEPLYVKDLLTGTAIDSSKRYTVYRSTGTPIQNLAVLKQLL